MRFPWISRSSHDEVCKQMVRALDEAHAREEKWADRYNTLLGHIQDVVRKQVPEPARLPERSRDEVIEAILARSGNNGQLRAHLSAYAQRMRREQTPDDQIIQSILVWGSPDDDDSSAGVP